MNSGAVLDGESEHRVASETHSDLARNFMCVSFCQSFLRAYNLPWSRAWPRTRRARGGAPREKLGSEEAFEVKKVGSLSASLFLFGRLLGSLLSFHRLSPAQRGLGVVKAVTKVLYRHGGIWKIYDC